MGNYDKIKKQVKERREFNEAQSRLHEKHENIPENVEIVEKSTAVRSTLSFLRAAARTIANIIFILLAATGLLTVLYPTTRTAFLEIINTVINEITSMI